MSLEQDITEIQKDIFKPVSRIERAARIKQRRKDVENRKDPNVDMCPHCHKDLRKEGVYHAATLEGYYPIEYKNGLWVTGEFEENDMDSDGFRCSNCDGILHPGSDEFDPLDDIMG
jgi:hypothetical protein